MKRFNAGATYKNLDQYLVGIRDIEELTGEAIPVNDFQKDEVPVQSWQMPIGCDRG